MPGMFETYGRGGSDRRASRRPSPSWTGSARPSATRRRTESRSRTSSGAGSATAGARSSGLPADADPYYHYDLDFIVTVPNMDPHIRSFETIREDDEEVVVKTGFETTIRKRFDLPMPEQVSWETDTIEKLEAFEFDDPFDRRRYFEAGDNQIAGVGDGFERNSPPWVETVRSLHADFPVFGSVTESSEITTRLLGQLNTLMWTGEYPERFGEQLLRIGEFSYRDREGADRGGGRPARRPRHLGRRRLRQEPVHGPRVLAEVLQADGRQDHRARPQPRTARHVPRLRQRQRHLRGHDRDRPRRLQPARGQGRPRRRHAARAPGPPAHVLRQQRHPRLGARRSGRGPARGPPPAAARPRAAATSS